MITPLGISTGPSSGVMYEVVGLRKKKGSAELGSAPLSVSQGSQRRLRLTFRDGIAQFFGVVGIIPPNGDNLGGT